MTRSTYLQVLYQGRIRRKPIANTTFSQDIQTLNDAYDFADALTALLLADNQQVYGYKIGATNPASMANFGIETPFFAKLTTPSEDGEPMEEPDITEIPLAALNAPMIEPELVFVATDTLTPTDDLATLATKLHVAPGIEIPDTRYADWQGNLSTLQFICDHAGAFGVLYEDKALQPCTYDSLAGIRGELFLNGESLGHNLSDNIYGHPLKAVQWLVQTLHDRGDQVTTGQIISSGSFLPPRPLEKGTYEAHYEGIGKIRIDIV